MSAFARSYAAAFLDAAPSGYDVGQFLDGAERIRDALTRDLRLKAFFMAPAVPKTAKQQALDELGRRTGLDPFAVRFVQMVLAHRRLLQLPEILATLRQEWDRRRGVVEARVRVASRVGPEEERQIADRLSAAVGKTVKLQTEVDPEILGGFVARIGSEIFDGSALRAIERFSEEAKETAGA